MIESGVAIIQNATRRLCYESGQEVNPRPVRDDLGELVALSMISREGPTISVHRVVQEVIRQRIPDAERQSWVQPAIALMIQYAPLQVDDPDTWPIWDLLRPHSVQLLAHASTRGALEMSAATQLMGSLGVLFYVKSLYSEAEPLLRQVLEIDLKLFGEDHPEVAVGFINLAVLLQATDRIAEAEPLMRSALEIDRSSFGDQHPLVARDLGILALLLMETGRWAEAEQLVRRALAIDQNAFQEDHPAIARDLRNLARLLTSTRRTAEAEPLIRRALEISQTVYGNAHPKTARKLQILAGILRDLGQQAEAEPLARQSVEIFEQLLGPDHPSTQSARRDLEAILARQDE